MASGFEPVVLYNENGKPPSNQAEGGREGEREGGREREREIDRERAESDLQHAAAQPLLLKATKATLRLEFEQG